MVRINGKNNHTTKHTERPVKDLKSNGFLDSLSQDSK